MAWSSIERRREWNREYKRNKRKMNPRIPKPIEERATMVYGYVPKKHWKEVQGIIDNIIKDYR